MLSRQRFRPKG